MTTTELDGRLTPAALKAANRDELLTMLYEHMQTALTIAEELNRRTEFAQCRLLFSLLDDKGNVLYAEGVNPIRAIPEEPARVQ